MAAQLARFELYLRATWRAENTRRLYLGSMRRWFGAGGARLHVDEHLLIRWLLARRKVVGQSTINLELRAIRAYFTWLHITGEIDATCQLVKLPRQRHAKPRLARYLDDEQIGKAFAVPDPTTFRGLRDLLIMRLLYECGLRSGELAALCVPDVQADGWLHIAHVQFGRARYLPIAADTMLLINHYIAERSRLKISRSSRLIVDARGAPLRARTIWEIVSRHLHASAGIGAGFGQLRTARKRRPWSGMYPHLLRTSFATALVNNGCPITAVCQLLGLADAESAAKYIGMDVTQLHAAAAKHPRAHRHATSIVAGINTGAAALMRSEESNA